MMALMGVCRDAEAAGCCLFYQESQVMGCLHFDHPLTPASVNTMPPVPPLTCTPAYKTLWYCMQKLGSKAENKCHGLQLSYFTILGEID